MKALDWDCGLHHPKVIQTSFPYVQFETRAKKKSEKECAGIEWRRGEDRVLTRTIGKFLLECMHEIRRPGHKHVR
jgi:hypothetical protein